MILVDWQLLDRIARGHIRIDPYDPKLVQPNSVDIRLGNHFVWYKGGSEVIDPYNPDSVSSDVEETHADTFILNPGQFVLAETLECIELPDNIVATIEGKSSIARLGVTLHQTGGWIDAGFPGHDHARDGKCQRTPGKGICGHADRPAGLLHDRAGRKPLLQEKRCEVP